MRSTLIWSFVILVVIGVGRADDQLSFEAASVRPSRVDGYRRMSGGPGTQDPGRFVCENGKLTSLLVTAYGITRYRLDAPAALDSRKVDVVATVPLGHTRAEFRIMLQRLLAERFECRTHWETRALQVYSLEEARGGRKFNESAAATTGTNIGAAALDAKPALGTDGYPELKGTRYKFANRLRLKLRNAALSDLVSKMELQLPIPVVDRTGLKGRYDFVLSWISGEGVADHVSIAPAPADGLDETGPNLFAALQQQLGLRLTKAKVDFRVLVVDHMREVPTDN